MKLRINKQSIRLRLSQHDVELLRANNTISESLICGMKEENLFIYKLLLVAEGFSEVKVTQNKINIIISKNEIKDWLINDELVSFERSIDTSATPLSVLIERDFKCLTPRSENEEGLFGHRNKEC